MVGRDLEERRAVRQRFTAAYGARSGFVHHGQSVDDHRMVGAFMDDAWTFFRSVVFATRTFDSQHMYIDAVEDEMFAGPTSRAPTSDEPGPFSLPDVAASADARSAENVAARDGEEVNDP